MNKRSDIAAAACPAEPLLSVDGSSPTGHSTDTDHTVSALLLAARSQVELGLLPQRPMRECLAALGPVLAHLHDQPRLSTEHALRPEVLRAVLRIAQHLETSDLPQLPQPTALSVRHEESIRTGALLLAAYRAALLPLVEGTQMARDFGLHDEDGPSPRDGLAVADGISRFITAALAHPTLLLAARLSPRQLGGLETQERVLRAELAQRIAAQSQPASLDHTTFVRHVLHLALEAFLDRFRSVVLRVLVDRPKARLAALSLWPGLSSPIPPKSDRLQYAHCCLTDSGRLVSVC